MPTVREILAAAAQLSPDDLRELRREIDRLDRATPAICLSADRVTCRLTRLDDGEFANLLRRSLAIDEDYGFEVCFWLALAARGDALNFAQVYLALREIAGESGWYFDHWKGSFSFPFALEVRRAERSFSYLLEIRNQRDSLCYPIRRIVAPEDRRLKEYRIHPPFADEFSREEINRFLVRLYGYLTGVWRGLRGRPLKPFLHAVPSNLIVFGYCGGVAFEEHYDSEEAYHAACQSYEERIREEEAAPPQPDACVIVEPS
jgi:hypothetical protein